MVLTKNEVKLHELATPDDVYTKITLYLAVYIDIPVYSYT